MDEISYLALKRFYQKLFDTIEKKREKITKRSIFLTFLNKKSNVRGQLLRESSIPSYKVSREGLLYLENNRFIRKAETSGNYIITAKGIWEIENNTNVINNVKLLDFLDDKFFNISKDAEKSLSDKQKVIILSMIAVRAFSDESPLDLKTSESTLNSIKETVDETYKMLKSLKLISKLEFNELYGKKGNEHPVSNLFRHTDDLPKRTRGLFRAAGNQKYYLDLYSNNQFSKDNLKSLFDKLFGSKRLGYSEIEDMLNFCQDIAHEKSIFLFRDIKKHIFSKMIYDDIIRDTVFLLI